jgi:hypothetical protein
VKELLLQDYKDRFSPCKITEGFYYGFLNKIEKRMIECECGEISRFELELLLESEVLAINQFRFPIIKELSELNKMEENEGPLISVVEKDGIWFYDNTNEKRKMYPIAEKELKQYLDLVFCYFSRLRLVHHDPKEQKKNYNKTNLNTTENNQWTILEQFLRQTIIDEKILFDVMNKIKETAHIYVRFPNDIPVFCKIRCMKIKAQGINWLMPRKTLAEYFGYQLDKSQKHYWEIIEQLFNCKHLRKYFSDSHNSLMSPEYINLLQNENIKPSLTGSEKYIV